MAETMTDQRNSHERERFIGLADVRSMRVFPIMSRQHSICTAQGNRRKKQSMTTFGQRLEQAGQDFAVRVQDVPDICQYCGASIQTFDIRFIPPGVTISADNVIGAGDGLMAMLEGRYAPSLSECASRGVSPDVLVMCPNTHFVLVSTATVEEWEEAGSGATRESGEISQIRRIYARIQKSGVDVPYPNQQLLESTFVPGRMGAQGVWVSNWANVDSRASLHAPLLIGAGVTVEAGAVCGPNALIVDGTIVTGGETIRDRALVNSTVAEMPPAKSRAMQYVRKADEVARQGNKSAARSELESAVLVASTLPDVDADDVFARIRDLAIRHDIE